MSSWPPSKGLTTKVVSCKDTVLPTYASIKVSAPASVVLEVLRETSQYSSWNSFCPKITIHTQPDGIQGMDSALHRGTSFSLHVVMDASKPNSFTETQLRVTDLSTPEQPSDYLSKQILEENGTFTTDLSQVYRIAWKTEGGFIARGLKSERFHEIIPGENGESCEVRTWECQGGIIAWAVKWMYGSLLMEKFEQWCQELKTASEAKARGRGDA